MPQRCAAFLSRAQPSEDLYCPAANISSHSVSVSSGFTPLGDTRKLEVLFFREPDQTLRMPLS